MHSGSITSKKAPISLVTVEFGFHRIENGFIGNLSLPDIIRIKKGPKYGPFFILFQFTLLHFLRPVHVQNTFVKTDISLESELRTKRFGQLAPYDQRFDSITLLPQT